jgi:hypothetical protein
MFKSRTREIVFSQYEHGRLAGTVARLWGNESFARPALDFDAFAAGVMLHDWGYGVLDNLPIGESAEEDWLEVVGKGVENRFYHPTTDIVVKLHIRRLLSMITSAEREAFIAQIDERIAGRLREGDAPLETYQQADKITQLCDMISFSFCFESAAELTYDVYAQPAAAESTGITYQIQPGGEVRVDPWPFSVPAITGVLYAFEREGYPQTLKPLVVPFNISRLPDLEVSF